MIFMFPEVIRRQVLPRQTNNYSYGWSSLSCNRKELQTVETNQHVTTLIPIYSEFVSNFSLMVPKHKTPLN